MSKNHESNNEKKVGYKKPPEKTQFKKGKSGNPRGRPKKSDHLYFGDLCIDMMNEKITITENGTKKEILKKEAFVRALFNHCLSGKAAHAKLVMDMLHKYVMPHEERKIEKAAAQEKIDNWKPLTAIEAAANYKAMIKSLDFNE